MAKIKYEKPRVVTCKDCIAFKRCLDSMREHPCRDFKDKRGEHHWLTTEAETANTMLVR